MARNESLASMVMLLCFGTAILSLAVHWRNQNAANQPAALNSSSYNDSDQKSSNGVYRPTFPVGIGDVALAETPQKRNVATQTKGKSNQKSRLITTKVVVNPSDNDWPKPRLAVNVAQPKTNIFPESNQAQLMVDLSDRRVYVYRNDYVIASYPIAIGKKGWDTPTGNFQVVHKEHDPIWKHPITGKVFEAGTDSPLGERWIGFWSDGRNEIGFHGTPDIDLIGEAVSHGCLRMRNSDIKLLYDQVSLGTTVLVRE